MFAMNPHDDTSQQHAANARIAWLRFFSKPAPNLALRIVVMFFGLICIALGIAMAKHAGIGTSPISSLPAVLTEASVLYGIPMTMGAWTFVFNMLYFLLEIALLRSRFAPIQFLQIPLFFVLSVSVDAWLAVLQWFPPAGYVQQMAFLLASIVVLGFGIRVQLASDLLMTPGDAAVQVVSYVSRRRFSSCKVAWDVTLMCLAAIASLVLLGGLFQVREGTISCPPCSWASPCAHSTARCARWHGWFLSRRRRWCPRCAPKSPARLKPTGRARRPTRVRPWRATRNAIDPRPWAHPAPRL